MGIRLTLNAVIKNFNISSQDSVFVVADSSHNVNFV